MIMHLRATLVAIALTAGCATHPARLGESASASGPSDGALHVYGPGGPLPAMKEAAAAFEKLRGVTVTVVGGPTPTWLDRGKRDADVVFSGAEHMMTDFIQQLEVSLPGSIDPTTIVPLYLRPSAILVRPGNPKSIHTVEDLLRPGIKVLAVQGAGQTGLWEDIAGRTGDITVVRALRKNLGAIEPNSGVAKKTWIQDPTYDAWLIWNVWQVANPALADLVPMTDPWVIYRDAGVALTVKGRQRTEARQFVEFLQSQEGARIFAKWGWKTR